MTRIMPYGTQRRLASGRKQNNSSLSYTVADCPLGRLLLARSERGLCFLSISSSDRALEADLSRRYPTAEVRRADGLLRPWLEQVQEHLRGRRPDLDLPLDLAGTAFQRRVWDELRRIPYGDTRTYGEVARAIGRPAAVRAVGQACGANPVAVVVPCHRVVRTDGSLGGYGLGLEQKRKLLEQERLAGSQR
jgi:AraC family transcriptional regulator of adaptative response/methylated-DNA-[protein]-cysteine methyltransferase